MYPPEIFDYHHVIICVMRVFLGAVVLLRGIVTLLTSIVHQLTTFLTPLPVRYRISKVRRNKIDFERMQGHHSCTNPSNVLFK